MTINLTEWRMENGEWRMENKNSPFLVPCSAQKGFTLVETLVALSILLIAVVGPISLIGDSLHKIYYARDEMIAINLAQEGIEMVRQKRDSNMLAGALTLWDAGLDADNYIVDTPTFSLISCVVICDDTKVYLDADGLYRQDDTSITATQFSRTVRIETIHEGIEMKVTSTVTWNTGGDTGTISVSENLFKWPL